MQEITIEGGEFFFEPSEIRVKAGSEISLTFVNTGSVPHNYVVSDLGVGTKLLSPGECETVEFTVPSDPDTLEISSKCTVPGHAEQGMVGQVVIE